MQQPFDHRVIFVAGIGTDVGKTWVSAILTRAMEADYWKPVQSGSDSPTDTQTVARLASLPPGRVHQETYLLKTPVSPHRSAQIDGIEIEPERILADYRRIASMGRPLVIEGAGGWMVPLGPDSFYHELVNRMSIPVVLVSSQYLGSLNHSLLTASAMRQKNIQVVGWVFNKSNGNYEEDLVRWTGIPRLASIPQLSLSDMQSVDTWAPVLRDAIQSRIDPKKLASPHHG